MSTHGTDVNTLAQRIVDETIAPKLREMLLIGVEFGITCAEKGLNMQAALQLAKETLDKK